jgi:hypothetical protein
MNSIIMRLAAASGNRNALKPKESSPHEVCVLKIN